MDGRFEGGRTARRVTALLGRSRSALAGLVVVGAVVAAGAAAPLLAPRPYDRVDLDHRLEPPSGRALLGTDALGRDVLSRVLFGARISMGVAMSVVAVSLLIGALCGSLAGLAGGAADEILMRLVDVLLAFPGILLAIAMVAVLGPDIRNVIIGLGLIGWVGFARMSRGLVLKVREMDYIKASRCMGAGPGWIVRKHVLPNIAGPLLVQATLSAASVIVAEASLSFLGLGVAPPFPSWGSMINEGRAHILEAPHLTLFPGLAIFVTVMGLNFLGDALRDALDPTAHPSGRGRL